MVTFFWFRRKSGSTRIYTRHKSGLSRCNVAGGCPDPASKLTWIWIHRNPNPELKLMMIQNYGSNGISKENYKDSNLCCPQHSNPGWWQHDNYPEPVLKSGPEILYKKWKPGPQFKSGSEKIRQSSSTRIRKSARGINQGWAAVNLAGVAIFLWFIPL